MKKYQAQTDGWAINGEILQIVAEEGYAALRIIPTESGQVEPWETVAVSKDHFLPLGADTLLPHEAVRNYGRVIFIDRVFAKYSNTKLGS